MFVDFCDEFIEVDGFGAELVEAVMRVIGGRDHTGGHGDDGQVFKLSLQDAGGFDTIHHRHVDIHENQIGSAVF